MRKHHLFHRPWGRLVGLLLLGLLAAIRADGAELCNRVAEKAFSGDLTQSFSCEATGVIRFGDGRLRAGSQLTLSAPALAMGPNFQVEPGAALSYLALPGTSDDYTLEDLVYTEDLDPSTRTDVEIGVEGIDSADRLTGAQEATHGYTTYVVAPDSMTQATAATDAFDVVEVGADYLVLSGNTQALQEGDIIVGVASDGQETPLLRRVVLGDDGQLVASDGRVDTERAKLEEAFPEVDLSIQVTAWNTQQATATGAARASRATLNVLQFERKVAHEFLPGVTGTAIFSMSSTFTTTLDLGWSWRSGVHLEGMTAVLDANPRAVARVDLDLARSVSREWSKSFNPIFDRTKVVFVYGVPIPINLKAVPQLGAKAEASAKAQAHFGLDVRATAEGGFRYTDSSGLTVVKTFTPQVHRLGPSYELEGGVQLRGEADLMVSLSVFEVSLRIPALGLFEVDGPGVGTSVGPFATFSATARATLDDPTKCSLDLSVGVASSLNIDFGEVGKLLNISNRQYPLYSRAWPLWHSDECPWDTTGSLAGQVTDAEEGTPLAGVQVQVTAAAGPRASTTTTTDADGRYRFEELVPTIYDVAFSHDGYEPATNRVRIEVGEQSNLNQALMADQNDETGPLKVQVKDAQNNTPIAGASFVVRKNLSDNAGEAFTSGTTGSDGSGTVEVPVGYYTVEASADGYDPGSASVTVKSTDNGGGQVTVLLSRTQEGGQMRIVLTWGAEPPDLDSHLEGPGGHIYYAHKTTSDGSLDVDDVTSYGPETVTIQVDPTQTYTYWVHNYSGTGSIATSGARVVVYYQGMSYEFTPPASAVMDWYVFTVENGQIQRTSSGSGSALSREPRTPDWMYNLPPK